MLWPRISLAGLLLVTTLLASAWEHAGGNSRGTAFAGEPGEARRQAFPAAPSDEALTPVDRNWRAFWTNHLGQWHGRWTRYTSSGSVTESFRSTRDFHADPSQTHIQQVNRYRYDDGRVVEERWSYNRSDHSRADGFHHPASLVMRGLAFRDGAAAWLVPTLAPDAVVPMELFLMDGHRRHSVGVVYGKDRQLIRTASIREDQRGYPGVHWTEQTAQVSPWQVTGHWVGVTETMGPDLSRSIQRTRQITWPSPSNREVYFPDRIVLSCPERLPLHQPFSVAVRWLSADGRLQIIRVDYDAGARLTRLQHQVLRRAPRSGMGPG
jgi:hypothetical protein